MSLKIGKTDQKKQEHFWSECSDLTGGFNRFSRSGEQGIIDHSSKPAVKSGKPEVSVYMPGVSRVEASK